MGLKKLDAVAKIQKLRKAKYLWLEIPWVIFAIVRGKYRKPHPFGK